MALDPLSKLHIRPLLKLNDDLRKLAAYESDINVTSIVVVGDQSHGKTSVVEALSGVELPRGEGIQTRVPLVLALRKLEQTPSETTGLEEKAEYALIKAEGIEEKRIDLGEIASEVRRCTDMLAGGEAQTDVVDKEIELTVFRRDQDDLTLIDLPGMTRVAINGQHKDIETTITHMYERYMRPQEAILLNIVSAMVDFSTSKSLQMSRELDPNSERTLMCITKADQHTDPGLLEKVTGATLKMSLPQEHVFCVRNRSQPENDGGVALAEARASEAAFFNSHQDLCQLPEPSKGVHALASKLVSLQCERIHATLPRAATTINARVKKLEQELQASGTYLKGEVECRMLAQERLHTGIRGLRHELEGRSSALSSPQLNQLVGDCVEINLEIEDLSAIRSTRVFGKAGAVSGPEATSGTGTTLFLTVYPRSNAKMEQPAEGNSNCDDVAVFVCMSGVPSIECEYTIQVHDHNNHLIKENPQDCTTIDDGGGKGSRAIFNAKTANSIKKNIRFSATVFICSVKTVPTDDSKTAQENMLCASIFAEDSKFGEKVQRLYPNSYFFSTTFRKIIEREVKMRQGAIGLPGTILPEPAVAVLARLRSRLPALVQGYVEAVAELVEGRSCRTLGPLFSEFPLVALLVKTASNALFERKKKDALAMTANLLQWEDTVHTHNHYYMATVQALRKKLLVSEEKDDEETPVVPAVVNDEFAFLTKHASSLGKLSNEEQKYLDLQIEIFAYWKTMKKRLIDYVHLATRSILVKLPIETELSAAIQLQMEQQSTDAGGFNMLMAPDATRRRKIEHTRARLHALQKAQRLLKQASVQARSVLSVASNLALDVD